MSHSLAERLKNKLRDKNLTVSELEKKAKLKPFSVRNITRGLSKKPSAENLQAIANALDCRIQDLLDDQGYSPLMPPKPLQSEIIVNPVLFEEVLDHVMQHLRMKQQPPTLGQIFLILQEVYEYTLSLNPPSVDRNFIKWIIQKILP